MMTDKGEKKNTSVCEKFLLLLLMNLLTCVNPIRILVRLFVLFVFGFVVVSLFACSFVCLFVFVCVCVCVVRAFVVLIVLPSVSGVRCFRIVKESFFSSTSRAFVCLFFCVISPLSISTLVSLVGVWKLMDYTVSKIRTRILKCGGEEFKKNGVKKTKAAICMQHN